MFNCLKRSKNVPQTLIYELHSKQFVKPNKNVEKICLEFEGSYSRSVNNKNVHLVSFTFFLTGKNPLSQEKFTELADILQSGCGPVVDRAGHNSN